jgi:hypothetical protein
VIAQLDSSYIRIRPWKIWSRMISYLLFEGRPLTTRGRWINPFVFLFLKTGKRLPIFKRVKKPIFIIGTGRSGTTMLGKILSIHRDVGWLNEPKALWHVAYPEEDLIGNYSDGNAFYTLTEKHVAPEIKKSLHTLYSLYLTITFSNRVLDKYPELIFKVPFVKAIFPDAKFIFLIRNGWDACQSVNAWSKRFGKESESETVDWWGINRRKWRLLVEQVLPDYQDLYPHKEQIFNWTDQRQMAALEWIVTMREGLKIIERFPHDVLKVHYEDLVQNFSEEIMRIIKFLELESDNCVLSYGKNILKPLSHYEPFNLNPEIEKPFLEVMEKLGYL